MSHYFTNEKLESKLAKRDVIINDKNFVFYTDNGVFSKRGLDYGSRVLILSLLSEGLSGDVLDLGCGVGVIGIILSSFFDITCDMIDVNKRAIHLSEMNIKMNKVSNINTFYSNIYENISKKYDYIVTNPPIRAGKDVYYKMLFDSYKYLKENGTLYFVINKDQGANSVVKDLSEKGKAEIITKNKGFFVIKFNFN